MSYFPEVAWGAIAKNVIPLYQEGVFQLNKYLIDVTPLDVNEPGAMLMSCIVGDSFIDFLGYVYRIDNIESTAYGLKLLLYDINERSVSEYINYGPYQDRIGYIYRPTKYGIILSQAQILKLDSQARDRIGNIEKGVIWENLFHIDQTYPQTIFGGVPLFSSGLYTDFIDFNLESEIESQEGRLSWDIDAGTLKLGLPGGNVTGQLFQEMLEKVKNESGVTITNGKAVYVSGSEGRNITIGLGDCTDYNKSFIFGVATESILNNQNGYICTRGKVGGINTSAWEVNDKLWLTTNGDMSNIPPEAPGIKVFIGVVLIKHATEGAIDIKPTFVPRMSGLSDVYGTPSLDGQVYAWDTTEQRFILKNLADSYWEQTPTTYELTYSDGEVFALNSMTVDGIITIGKSSFLDYSMMKLELGVDPIDNSYGLSQVNNLYSSKIASYKSDGKIIYGRESGESGITLNRDSSTFYYVGFNNNTPSYPYHFKNGTVAIESSAYGSSSLAFLNSSYGNVTPYYIGQRTYANGSKGISIGDGTTDFVYFNIANSTIGLSTFDIEAWDANFSVIEATNSSIMFANALYDEIHINSNSYYTGTWKYKSSGMAANYRVGNGEHRFRTAATGIIDNDLTWDISLKVTQNGTFVDKKLFVGITTPPSVDTSGTLNSLVWDSSTGEVKQRNVSSTHTHTFASITNKPTTLSGYGITDAANAVHGHNYIVPILSGTLPEILTDYASYCANYHKGVSVIVNGGSSAVGNVGASDTVVNFGSGRFRFFRLLNNRGGSLRWQTSNFDTTDFATERTLFDNYNFASYCPDLSAIESISDTNGLLRKTAANTWALDTNNYSLSTHQHSFASITNKPTTLSGYGITDALAASLKGAANGLAELDSGGKVPSSQLPSYVDDVLEYTTFSLLPSVGESGKIYITTDTNKTYRWSGSVYTEISPSLALGETSATAYRGDRGKTAYDHSQSTGNPHSTTFAQLGSKPTTLSGYGITDAIPSNINTGRHVTDGVNLTGTYLPGSIRVSTQGGETGYPSSVGVTYTFDAATPSRVFSIFAPELSNDLYIQRYDEDKVGSGWYKIFTTANLEPLALGETSAKAYRGDRGKIAYDHSLATGNPHNTAFVNITNRPTTLSGYDITDAYTKNNLQTSGGASVHWNNITSKPTTLAGYGITDALTKLYEPYSPLNYNSTITWDCSTGLNKTLTASGDFTIKFTHLENGMSGDLRITSTSSTTITITLPSGSKLNGNVSYLPAGIYHLAWVCTGSVLDFNIASYE